MNGEVLDQYLCVGYAVELLAQSNYHKQFPMVAYVYEDILQPFELGQIRFYLDDNHAPTGFVTWAWLSTKIRDDVHESGRPLEDGEWQSGEHLYFNDFVAPYNNMKPIVQDVAKNVFPDQIGTSLRRNMDGSVRRINKWVGTDRLTATTRDVA